VSKWEPIDTAPKDGTKILACFSSGTYAPETVSWRTYHPNAQGKRCWRTVAGIKAEWVSHWMPLPERPSLETEVGK
jgi:hypothetical protein